MRRLAMLVFLVGVISPLGAQRPVISTRPDTPFKLATFEAAGKTRVGLVLGSRILDIEGANAAIVQAIDLRGGPAMPRDMRTLIDTYDTIAPSLFATGLTAGIPQEFEDALTKDAAFPKRMGKPDEYGALVEHICTNTMLNGEVIRIDGRELQAARGRDVSAGQPAAEGGERSRSGQGGSGLLREVAAILHHRSGRKLRDPARTEHRLGRRAGDHRRQAGVQSRRGAGARDRLAGAPRRGPRTARATHRRCGPSSSSRGTKISHLPDRGVNCTPFFRVFALTQ